jgi:hypothetical protein
LREQRGQCAGNQNEIPENLKPEADFIGQEKIRKRAKKFSVARLYSRNDADIMLARLIGENACHPL